MKAYTDLEQSKKLEEILPIESADMVLLHEDPYETSDSKFDGLHQALCVPFSQYDKSWRQKYRNISYFPCWSLVALLNSAKYNTINLHYNDGRNDWMASCTIEHSTRYESGRALNPIDAVFEMIIKLHEQKLL